MFTRHYNKAMGKMVHTKEDYLRTMKEMKLMPSKEADQLAKEKTKHKPYKPTEDAMRFMTHVTHKKEKDGKIKFSGRELNEMQKLGVNFTRPKERPLKGGFDAV